MWDQILAHICDDDNIRELTVENTSQLLRSSSPILDMQTQWSAL